MNSINDGLSKFNYYIEKIADNTFDIFLQNTSLILSKSSRLTVGSLSARLGGVVNYISSHAHLLNPSNLKLIKRIQNKFAAEAKAQDQKIQKTTQPLLTKLDSLLDKQKQDFTHIPSICLQVASPPESKQDLKYNLELVLEHFPRYQLHNDLSVFDVTHNSLPDDWNIDKMHETLQAEFTKYQGLVTDEFQITTLSLIKDEIFQLYKVPKPIKMGIIIETSSVAWANKATLISFMMQLKDKIPCVVNRQLFLAQVKHFNEFPNFKIDDYDIYLQKFSDLCVVVPKGHSLKDSGFNEDTLDLSKGEHLFASPHSTDLASDVQSLLINETEKHRFFRMIAWTGHGFYPGFFELDVREQGQLSGLLEGEFQKTLLSLTEKNLAFLYLHTCFGGGTNSAAIHLPNETIPCPIYIQSAFDTVSVYTEDLNECNYVSILNEAQKILFPLSSPGASFQATPHPLTIKDSRKLAVGLITHPQAQFTNLGTLILPSNKEDIPKIAYTLADNEDILDVSRAGKNKGQEPLEDKNLYRKAYVFSDPIVPFSLTVSGVLPMIFLSRGGTTHHVLKQVIAPHQNLEDIAKETFNAFQVVLKENDPEPTSKVFFIANLKCRFDGKEAHLTHVMIKNASKEREIIFQIEGEDRYHRLIYKADSSKTYSWKKDRVEILSSDEALKAIYLAAAVSTPSQKTLSQVTAGKISPIDIIESLDQLFFPEQMPPVAKLYSAMLKDDIDRAVHLKKALKEIKDEFSAASIEQWHNITRQAYDMAATLNISHFQTLMEESTYNPLMLAIKDRNKELAQTLLKENPQMLEDVNMNGSTALSVALSGRRPNVILANWLVEQGANLDHVNRFGIGPIYLVCYKGYGFIRSILQKKGNLRGDQGAKALVDIIKSENWKQAELLIDHFAGADSQKYAVLLKAVENHAAKTIIEKLLRYPNLDINQAVSEKIPVLHYSLMSSWKDFEVFKLLLEKGANPNATDDILRTPLHLVAKYGDGNAVELAKDLLKAGVSIDLKDMLGRTALHYAILDGNKGLIEFLIQQGASLLMKDTVNTNFLDYAAIVPDLLEFILQIPNIDVNLKDDDLHNTVLLALKGGNITQIKALVSHGAKINYKDVIECLPVTIDPEPFIQILIDQKVDLSLQDSKGETLMHEVMRKQKFRFFKCLKKAKIPIHSPLNNDKKSPFMLAFSVEPNEELLQELLQEPDLLTQDIASILKESFANGYVTSALNLMKKVIELLIAKGEATSNPSLHLYKAVLEKDHEGEKKWFEQYPNTKPADFYGLPILQLTLDREIVFSVMKNFPECSKSTYLMPLTQLTEDVDILKALIQHGAEVDPNIPLKAVDLELIKLLDEKALVDFSGKAGLVYLDNFIQNDFMDGIKFLLPKINVSAHDELTRAIFDERSEEILDLLVNHPHMDLQKGGDTLGSPLCTAIYVKNTTMVKTLLSKKAAYKTNSRHSMLASPFHMLACLTESNEVIEIANLLMSSEYKNSINTVSPPLNHTPLIVAIKCKNIPLATFLINKGAEVNIKDKEGYTPLHAALLLGTYLKEDKCLPLITLMIEKGAKWNMPSNEGLTAKDIAVKLRLGKVVQLMQ